MKHPRALLLSYLCCGFLLSACDSVRFEDDSALADRPALAAVMAGANCTLETGGVLVRNFLVCLDERIVSIGSEGPITTYTYAVVGTGASPDLSHFVVGINACDPALALADFTSGGVLGTDPTTGVSGLKWDQSVGKNSSALFSLTFEGDIPEGTTNVAVKSGNGFSVENVAGAGCAAPAYDVSGTVFIDADADHVQSAAEFGISGVTVELLDALQSVVATTSTDGLGAYTFANRPAGSYVVRIPFSTTAVDFNEQLASAFTATTPTSINVALPPDSPGNDFGFDVDTDRLVGDFESGALTSTAEDTKFWREQFKKALSGPGTQNTAVVKKAELQRLLDLIEGELQEPGIQIFLAEPFIFGAPGNAGDEDLILALAILNPPQNRNDPHLDFVAALLMAELNYVSGRDINNAPGLLETILAWAESLYAAELSASKSAGTQATLSGATKVLIAYGGSGGIDN